MSVAFLSNGKTCSTLRMICIRLELSGRSHRDGGTNICTPELVLFALIPNYTLGVLMTLAGQEVPEDPSIQTRCSNGQKGSNMLKEKYPKDTMPTTRQDHTPKTIQNCNLGDTKSNKFYR